MPTTQDLFVVVGTPQHKTEHWRRTKNLVLGDIELHVVCVAPDGKVPHQSPVLLLLVLSDAPHDGRVISKLPDVTRLRVVAEVRGVQGEEERRQHSPLRSTSAADQSLLHDVL